MNPLPKPVRYNLILSPFSLIVQYDHSATANVFDRSKKKKKGWGGGGGSGGWKEAPRHLSVNHTSYNYKFSIGNDLITFRVVLIYYISRQRTPNGAKIKKKSSKGKTWI